MKIPDRINIKGGVIAPDHPFSFSGAPVHVLDETNAQCGLAAICIGMGQGIATVLQRVCAV